MASARRWEAAMKKLSGNLLLLAAAFIWGIAFVAQSAGMDYIEPFTFQACRWLLGAGALLPLALYRAKRAGGAANHARAVEGARRQPAEGRGAVRHGAVHRRRPAADVAGVRQRRQGRLSDGIVYIDCARVQPVFRQKGQTSALGMHLHRLCGIVPAEHQGGPDHHRARPVPDRLRVCVCAAHPAGGPFFAHRRDQPQLPAVSCSQPAVGHHDAAD